MLNRLAIEVELDGLRNAGLAMIGVAAIVPLLPLADATLCPLRRFTGFPCPLCGMTTSVVAATEGHVVDALGANPLGVVAVLLVLCLVAWRVGGRTVKLDPKLLLSVALMAEAYQLHRFGFF